MTFEVKLHPRVARFIKRLDPILSERIRKKLRQLKDEPFRFLEHHEGADVFKLRIGDYRALIDVDAKRKVLLVRHLDHRRRIYKHRH